MKHSRLFLGVTAWLLAAASIAAAKVHRNNNKSFGYYTSLRALCTALRADVAFYTDLSGQGLIATNGQNPKRLLYSQPNTQGICVSARLFTASIEH